MKNKFSFMSLTAMLTWCWGAIYGFAVAMALTGYSLAGRHPLHATVRLSSLTLFILGYLISAWALTKRKRSLRWFSLFCLTTMIGLLFLTNSSFRFEGIAINVVAILGLILNWKQFH